MPKVPKIKVSYRILIISRGRFIYFIFALVPCAALFISTFQSPLSEFKYLSTQDLVTICIANIAQHAYI
ncbi:hypothetical protein D1BOALGB6SA_8404 [Olavius sp. associated proteobacterium Delta 1]|nr:hypothetical protein D1BOALGB6SA_8404 [Olavius sp. associated proteobacterium Delta 1]